MAIITVSRQCFSLGDEIAKNVADDLGYDFIDKQRIGGALAQLGLPAAEMDRFDEKKPSVWDTLATHHTKFLFLMRAAIYDFARKNDTLILGRGAQVLLKDLPGTLHVRIVAPMQVRLERLMAQAGYDEKNGEKVLRQSDRDSAGYIRSFFGEDWNDPDFYDMVINTKAISMSTAAAMITSTIQSSEFKSDPDAQLEKLAVLSLEQQVEVAIMEVQRGNTIYVAVTNIEDGIITLSGTTDSEAVREDCVRAVAKIKDVKGVKNQIMVVKAAYG
jgi:cytidylate kinase